MAEGTEVICAYKYKLTLKFFGDTSSDDNEIPEENIKYVVVDSAYLERMMPIVFISVTVSGDTYAAIYKAQNKKQEGVPTDARFVLKIERLNKLAQSAIYETILEDEFDFVISRENPDYEKELEKANVAGDIAYRSITIALLSSALLNAIRAEKDANNSIEASGVFADIDMNTILAIVFQGIENYGLKTVMKVPVHNTLWSKNKLIIPPMNNRKQIISFLFDKAPFYNTAFRFFVDFKYAYLLNREKDGVKIKNTNQYHDVVIEIFDSTDDNAYKEGMTLKNNSYIVYINPSKSKVTPNRSQDKVANTIITVSDSGKLDAATINANSAVNSDPKYIFSRGTNARLYKNNADSSVVTVFVAKENLDGAIFTPNKRYRVKNYGAYTKYDGYYYLEGKKEVIYNNSSEFTGRVELVLQKIAENIEDIGDTTEDGEVVYANGDTGESNVDEALANANISRRYSSGSYGTRYGASANVPDTVTGAVNPYFSKSGSSMINVTSISGRKSSLGMMLGSDSIDKFEKGKLEGEKLEVEPVALGSPPQPTIEEQIMKAERNRTPRKHGNEVDYNSSLPDKVYKYNENISLNTYIDI